MKQVTRKPSQCDLYVHCCCAAVIDGHGGLSSAAWLQQHLYEDVMARLDQSFLQPDPAAQEVPGRPAVVRPSKLEQTMVDAFHQADKELLQHLLGKYACSHVQARGCAWQPADTHQCFLLRSAWPVAIHARGLHHEQGSSTQRSSA
jgi:hypothetical protein